MHPPFCQPPWFLTQISTQLCFEQLGNPITALLQHICHRKKKVVYKNEIKRERSLPHEKMRHSKTSNGILNFLY